MAKEIKRIGSSQVTEATCMEGVVTQRDNLTTSVFDRGPIPGFESGRIGRMRVAHTYAMFTLLGRNGVKTHCISKLKNDEGLRVREVRVRNLPLLSPEALVTPRMIGLEVLVRTRVSKKFYDRIMRGEVDRDEVILPPGEELRPGVWLLVPYVEFSTKWDDVDGYLLDDDAKRIGKLGTEALEKLKKFASGIGIILEKFCARCGYELVDFKIEVAVDPETDEFIVIDRLSLDEMGVTKDGVHYGKNPIRDHYKVEESKFYNALQEAQERYPDDKSKWPEMPPLPEQLKIDQIFRYEDFALTLYRGLAE